LLYAKSSAKGTSWEIKGIGDYYIFEKAGDSWLLVDTDFHKYMSSEAVLGFILGIFGFLFSVFSVLIPIILVLGIFWLWMLIDCIKRDFGEKTVWILILIFLGFLGALLYFFLVRRKLKRELKSGGAVSSQPQPYQQPPQPEQPPV
jgi:hypothetical protein